MICYIPSKGRPQTKTYQLFESAGMEVHHFIEPSEMELYDVPGKVDIGKNDQGISFVRNFMLSYAKEHSHEWVIMCDDDVTLFGRYDENGKKAKMDASIWHEIFERVRRLPYEIVGINYVQHAWYRQRDVSVNSKFAEVCVLMNTSRINWRYRAEFDTKEDRDFAMQTIRDGAGILRFNRYFFSCPGVGANSGGLQDLYKKKRDELAVQSMCEEWTPFLTPRLKKDRIDIKADLKALALRQLKHNASYDNISVSDCSRR